MSAYTGIGTGGLFTGDAHDEYWRILYGDSTIGYVPPVVNYAHSDNISRRGINDRTFSWTEVSVVLEDVPAIALIDFLVPDSYIIEITPDIGWSNVLAMFGEDEELDIKNPHIVALGPFSITAGTLTDNGSYVTAVLSEAQLETAVSKNFDKYLWRAVPWADGNPGLGGLPAKFEYVSTRKQTLFSVDNIIKETKRPTQSVSGTKSPRLSITVSDQNNPDIFVEETNTTWRVQFVIDRPHVTFTVNATDSGGLVVAKHQVDIDYDDLHKYASHIWNQMDGFALFASLDRLPNESSADLKSRVIDTFSARGGSHYDGLVKGTNRELGLARIDDALAIARYKNDKAYSLEPSITVESTHTRIGILAPSFIITDEIQTIDKYHHTIFASKRINKLVSLEDSKGTAISDRMYRITDDVGGNEIMFDHDIKGPIFITYTYVEDIVFSDYPLLGDVVDQLNAIANPSGVRILDVSLSPKLSGSEASSKLYNKYIVLEDNNDDDIIGWSVLGLFAISNREYKESFKDSNSLYFGSSYYKYIVELKSQTNIEWGHIVADEDIWDAVTEGTYGHDSLEMTCDISLADFTLPVSVPTYKGRTTFDAWEAFRMGYYYNNFLIKNMAFNKKLFRSGVGFRKDCAVAIEIINISAEDSVVNQSPVVADPENAFDINEQDAKSITINY